MAEQIEQPAMARRGIAKQVYDFLLRPEASVIVVTVALVIYFEIANQNFLSAEQIRVIPASAGS